MKKTLFATTIYCILAGLFLGLPVGCDTDFDVLLTPAREPTRPDSAGATPTPEPIATPAPTATPEPTTEGEACLGIGSPTDSQTLELFELVNDYREQNGLNRLTYSSTLAQAANDYAERLYVENFFDHTAPDGSTPGDRALAAGFCHQYVGENIASGQNLLGTAVEAHQGFIDSPPHNENMLTPQWEYAGMGFYHVITSEGDHYRWVELFSQDISN